MSCNKLKKLNRFPVKTDPAFVQKVLRNWKKFPEAFLSHKISEYHRDYVKLLNDEETSFDIAEKFSDIHIRKKANNKQIF